MSRAIVLRRAARQELDDAALWCEERRIGLGSEFTGEIERAIRLSAEGPQRFPIMHRDVRCVRVRRFPYSVFFQIESARIVVLAVFTCAETRRSGSVSYSRGPWIVSQRAVELRGPDGSLVRLRDEQPMREKDG